MTHRDRPPFRADHVGSLLRPARLHAARARRAAGEIGEAELASVEDDCIREAIALQEGVGLEAVTDGEFRRGHWWVDFVSALDGTRIEGGLAGRFRTADGTVRHGPTRAVVTGRIARTRPIEVDYFRFLKATTRRMPKLCIPSPTLVHFRAGRDGIDRRAYPELDGFFADLASAWRGEIADLAEAGCRYLQLDDTNFAYLCDTEMREGVRMIGWNPDSLPRTYAALINDAIGERPADMVVTMHLCRGNLSGAWAAEGGYDPVAEVLFNEIAVDGYFLEYDTPRAGSFAPLRFAPKGKTVVLGLVTTKSGEMEQKDVLKRRIDEAARHLALDQLALSPQCGFASVAQGNDIDLAHETAKLRLVVEVASEVWG